ncbi:MAG: hypothetical protein QXF26_08195, partial [Candidatus Bathyarchaeia archaeon]
RGMSQREAVSNTSNMNLGMSFNRSEVCDLYQGLDEVFRLVDTTPLSNKVKTKLERTITLLIHIQTRANAYKPC